MKKPKDEYWHGYQTSASDRYGLLKDFSNHLRKNMTMAEAMLWDELKNNRFGFKFRRQHIIGDFIADFVCLSHKLIIEVDGDYHLELEQQESDEIRTDILADKGFTVIRFSNEEIESDAKNIAEKVYDKLFQLEEVDD